MNSEIILGSTGGGIHKVTSWISHSANAATNIDVEFKPKTFVLVVNKPTGGSQTTAFYTNINPTTGETDESGKWWRIWNDSNNWVEETRASYNVTNNKFTTSVYLSSVATVQGLIYTA